MRRGQTLRVLAGVAITLTLVAAAGCQAGRVGGRCRPGTVAQDATNVLVCRKGRWVVLISKRDGLALLAARTSTTTTAPNPTTAPPAPTTTITNPAVVMPPLATVRIVGSAHLPGWPSDIPTDLSADGRYTVYVTADDVPAAGDSDGLPDVFRHDAVTGTTILVSVPGPGLPISPISQHSSPSVSADGRLVAFISTATDLIAGVTPTPPGDPGRFDVYVRDVVSATTTRVLGLGGAEANGSALGVTMSDDGQAMVFASQATNLAAGDTVGSGMVFLRDLSGGVVEPIDLSSAEVPALTAASFGPFSMSSDRRFVAFTSQAANLVPGDTNGTDDVFVRDRVLGTTERVSVGSSGDQGAAAFLVTERALSADGRFVVFDSASDYVGARNGVTPRSVLRDRDRASTENVGSDAVVPAQIGLVGRAAISSDGSTLTASGVNGTSLLVSRRRDSRCWATNLLVGVDPAVSLSGLGVMGVSADGSVAEFTAGARSVFRVDGVRAWADAMAC